MSFKIGFGAGEFQNKTGGEEVCKRQTEKVAPRKSVVRVYFPDRERSFAYYNDKFDLKKGDGVFVEGKLEGKIGYITNVDYNFKIKLSDYKCVISVADVQVQGEMFVEKMHFIAFDRNALPKEKVVSWFKPVLEEEFECGSDGSSFMLDSLEEMGCDSQTMDEGMDYFKERNVEYICLDGQKGYAIVRGGTVNEVEFDYCDGKISNLVCSCYCCGGCRHEVAAMFELNVMLNVVQRQFKKEYEKTGYFAAIQKTAFYNLVFDKLTSGKFVMSMGE